MSDNNSEKQTVYILTNETMPGLVKVGRTVIDIKERMLQLYKTGVPIPFECFHASIVLDANNVERRIHSAFKKYRVNKNREFFEIEPESILEILEMVEVKDVTPTEDPIETADDEVAIKKLEDRKENFNFRMVDIKKGSILTFAKDENKTSEVIENNKVRYKNQELSLSAAALRALHELGYDWKSAHGAAYWEYEGESLKERRRRIETE